MGERLDVDCLLRGLADLKIDPGLFPGAVAHALATYGDRDAVMVQRRRELSLVARGERYCDACNIHFDKQFLDAYALGDGDRTTCARCKSSTLFGSVNTWIVQNDAEKVEFVDKYGVPHTTWRQGTPQPNTECLHAVGGSIVCWQGRRVTTRDEKERPNEGTLVREGAIVHYRPTMERVGRPREVP